VDIAQKVKNREPIDVSMGHFNALWQGDANAMALEVLAHVAVPPLAINLAGPETLNVRRVAEEFGRMMDVPVTFVGNEAPEAFLSNAQLSNRLFGYPRVPAQLLTHWIADWVGRGERLLGKPTHFENREGKY